METSVFTGVDSAAVVEAIFALHFPQAARVVDLTFGKGRFWKWDHPFEVVGVDIAPVVECLQMDGRNTTFPDQSFDVAVIDPPFMHGGEGRGSYQSTVGMNADFSRLRNQRDVLELYARLCLEAKRLSRGVVVKCKDTIEASKYIDNSRRIASVLGKTGWTLVDKAVLVPAVTLPDDPKWKNQQHFRRQESYFLVGKA